MKLTVSNTFITKKDGCYRVCINMPDGSRNYLHSDFKYPDADSACVVRDLLENQELYVSDVTIKEAGEYFRLFAYIKDVNGDMVPFHSRQINLNDAVYERMMLVTADE